MGADGLDVDRGGAPVIDDGLTAEERAECLRKMRAASSAFYFAAVQCGNHAFIEFTGLMNDYIAACEDAHRAGVDFTRANVHTGTHLPLPGYRLAYLDEKLECIYGIRRFTRE